jgi:hypothetical protein
VKSYLGAVLFILADVVLALIVPIRRHHIEPAVQPDGLRRVTRQARNKGKSLQQLEQDLDGRAVG